MSDFRQKKSEQLSVTVKLSKHEVWSPKWTFQRMFLLSPGCISTILLSSYSNVTKSLITVFRPFAFTLSKHILMTWHTFVTKLQIRNYQCDSFSKIYKKKNQQSQFIYKSWKGTIACCLKQFSSSSLCHIFYLSVNQEIRINKTLSIFFYFGKTRTYFKTVKLQNLCS